MTEKMRRLIRENKDLAIDVMNFVFHMEEPNVFSKFKADLELGKLAYKPIGNNIPDETYEANFRTIRDTLDTELKEDRYKYLAAVENVYYNDEEDTNFKIHLGDPHFNESPGDYAETLYTMIDLVLQRDEEENRIDPEIEKELAEMDDEEEESSDDTEFAASQEQEQLVETTTSEEE